MKAEKQRIKIAEACGFLFLPNGSRNTKCPHWGQPVPNYLNDLNAMNEAEEACIVGDDVQEEKYWLALYDVTESTRWPFDAKASQRAEAFLRTIGEWEDGE